jgi:hypothetical protein
MTKKISRCKGGLNFFRYKSDEERNNLWKKIQELLLSATVYAKVKTEKVPRLNKKQRSQYKVNESLHDGSMYVFWPYNVGSPNAISPNDVSPNDPKFC